MGKGIHANMNTQELSMWKWRTLWNISNQFVLLRLDREPEWPNWHLGGQWQGCDANYVGQGRSTSVSLKKYFNRTFPTWEIFQTWHGGRLHPGGHVHQPHGRRRLAHCRQPYQPHACEISQPSFTNTYSDFLIQSSFKLNLLLQLVASNMLQENPVKFLLKVYNCTSGSTNPLTWRQLQPLGLKSFEWVFSILPFKIFGTISRRFPFEGVYRYPYAIHREDYLSNRVAQVGHIQYKNLLSMFFSLELISNSKTVFFPITIN